MAPPFPRKAGEVLGNTPVQRTNLMLEDAKSFALRLSFLDNNGDPEDLTGGTVRLTADNLPHLGGGDVLDLTADLGTPTEGIAIFEMQASDLDLEPGEFLYDITYLTADGYSIPVVKGSILLGSNTDQDATNTYTGVDPSSELLVTLSNGNCISVVLNGVPGIEGPIGPRGLKGDPTGVFIQPDQPGNPGDEPPYFPLWVDTDEEQVSGVTDHGDLTGLADDDHPQYLTDARGDARYLQPTEVLAGTNITVDTSTTPGSVIVNSTSGAGVSRTADYSYGTVGAVPGNKQFTADSASLASVTWLRFDDTDNNGIDHTEFVAQLVQSGSRLLLQQADNGAVWAVFDVTGAPTDNGTYVEVPVSPQVSPAGTWPPSGSTLLDMRLSGTGGGGGDYLPLTGGNLTGPLGAPYLGSGLPEMQVTGSAWGDQTYNTTASVTLPADIPAGAAIIILSTAGNAISDLYPDVGATGFAQPPGFALASNVGVYGSGSNTGGTWYYKMADGTEGGTQITWTYGAVNSYRRLFAFVVENAPDPAVTPWEMFDNNNNPDVAADAVTWSTGGLMFSAGLEFSIGTLSTPPSSAWGTQVIGSTANAQYAAAVIAYGKVPSGGNPAVDMTFTTTRYGTGLLLIPGGTTAPVEMQNSIDMNNLSLLGLPDPVDATDAATKAYVDSGLAGKADTSHTHTESQITDLGSYPDATGQPATKVAQTDGANGWTFIDTPTGGGIEALSVKDYGVQGDAVRLEGSVTGTALTITGSSTIPAGFASGYTAVIETAGSDGIVPHVTTFTRNSATTATLAVAAPTARTGVRIWVGTDDTTNLIAARDAYIASFRSNSEDGLVATKSLYYPPGDYIFTGSDLFAENTGTSTNVLRGGYIFGSSQGPATRIIFANTQGPTNDRSVGNLASFYWGALNFRMEGISAYSTNPNLTFAWFWCSAVGGGGQGNFHWKNVELDGDWKSGWAFDGDNNANMNSEMHWDHCTTRYGATFGRAIVECGGVTETTIAAGSDNVPITGTPSEVFVEDATPFPTSGQGYVDSTGSGDWRKIAWTGKTATSLTGVTRTSGGSTTPATGDRVVSAPDQMDQFLNYEFIGCNFEFATGDALRFWKGGGIRVFGGSWIVGVGEDGASNAGTFFNLPYATHFDDACYLTVIGTRFEKRTFGTRLLESYWANRNAHITFDTITVADNSITGDDAESELIALKVNADQGGNYLPHIQFRNSALPGYAQWYGTLDVARGGISFDQCQFRDWTTTDIPTSGTNSTGFLRWPNGGLPRFSVESCDSVTNASVGMRDGMWTGTQAEYDALSPDYDPRTIYVVV